MNDRPRALVVLVSIFLAGCIIGAIGFFLWARHMPQTPPPGGGADYFRFRGRGGGPESAKWLTQWFSQMLQLTPEQTNSVLQIMTERHNRLDALDKEYAPQYDAVRAEHEPKIREIMADTDRKLSAILSEDQKKKLEQVQKQMEERRRRGPRREGGFGPPGPQPPPQNPEQKAN